MLYLGWIAAAFMGGILLTLWLMNRKKKPTLRQRFSVIDHYQGMRYDDILSRMKVLPCKTQRTPQGGTMRTWSEVGYSITLGFDQENICTGVAEERY